jgi:hypothetical protein
VFVLFLAPFLGLMIQGQFVLAAAMVGLIFLFLMFRRIDLWWSVGAMFIGSQIHLWSGNATIYLLGMSGFAGVVLMSWLMTQGRITLAMSWPRRVALFFVMIVVITGAVRGWGLQILGSTMWGGMQYVTVIMALLFYVFSGAVVLSKKQLWRVATLVGLLGLIPAVIATLVRLAPAVAPYLARFFSLVTPDNLQEGQFGVARFVEFQLPAVWAGLLAVLLYDRSFRFKPAVLAMIALSFLMMGAAGHRTVVVLLGLFILFYVIIRRHYISQAQYLVIAGLLVASLALAYLFAARLPLTFQRALSVLPGIQVDYLASLDAEATTVWRLEMWRAMLSMIPEYLLVGRGLGFDLREAYAAYTMASDRMYHLFMIATHNYHNGPLWLLVDLGLGGLLAGMAVMIGGIFYYGRRMHELPANTVWRSVFVVFYAFFSAYSLFFFVVIGTHNILPRILVAAAILEVTLRSAKAEQQREERAEAEREPMPAMARSSWKAQQAPRLSPALR